ncbi:hypothetical protein [uncultured Mediterranean phage]|nr:hypothetical protein [uncultured Mediterranean phage]
MKILKTILFCDNGINKIILKADKRGYILEQYVFETFFNFKDMQEHTEFVEYGAYCSTHIEDVQHEIKHMTKNSITILTK